MAIADVIEKISWTVKGCPVPPSDEIKVRTIKEYAAKSGIKTFVETGTYLGQMVNDTKDLFDFIVSIELEPYLYSVACIRFLKFKNIKILYGDSGKVLPRYIEDLKTPALFWLGAHYSGGMGARGEIITPVISELLAIVRHPLSDRHIILIDDARAFVGTNDYPALVDMKTFLSKRGFKMEVKDDIIRIEKRGR